MHLDAEVSGGINELDEEGEVCAVVCEVAFAEEFFFELLNQFREDFPLQRSFRDGSFRTGHGRYFPTFADLFRSFGDALEFKDVFAAPDGGFDEGFETECLHG